MIKPGADDEIYPVNKLAMVVDALAAEGVPAEQALAEVGVAAAALRLPSARVSLNQVIACYRNADRLSRDPHFAYRAGLRFHVSTYGIFGFAILSSTNFRQTAHFALNYHQLATPLADLGFREGDGEAMWTITPLSNPRIDARLYRFLVELQVGAHVALHRDIMGPEFVPSALHVTYGPRGDTPGFEAAFGCPVVFGASENRMVFDAAWLDHRAELGNEVTYASIVRLCDTMMEELKLNLGTVGRVRQLLLVNLMQPTSFASVAKHLNMSARTLRRKLGEESTSFRQVLDELRLEMAVRYLRDTNLTVDEIGYALGFSESANFRHAFRRWTKAAPQEFRGSLREG